jgi:hypothetical protein
MERWISAQGWRNILFSSPPPDVLRRVPNAIYPLDPSVHFRHHGIALVSFVDGHVRPLKRGTSVEQSGVYPEANPAAHQIGWFPPVTGDTYYDPE